MRGRRRRTLVGEIEALSPEEMALIDFMVKVAVRSRTPVKRRKPALTADEAEERFRAKMGGEYKLGYDVGFKAAARSPKRRAGR